MENFRQGFKGAWAQAQPLVVQMVKNPPATWETRVQSLGGEAPLEEGMATHSSILAWRIPWTEEPIRLQFMGSQRVGHDSVTEHKGPGSRELKQESGVHAPPLLRSLGGQQQGGGPVGQQRQRGWSAHPSMALCAGIVCSSPLWLPTSEMALVCGLLVSSCLQFVLTAHTHIHRSSYKTGRK